MTGPLIENQVANDRRIIGIPVEGNPTETNIGIVFDPPNNRFKFVPRASGGRTVLVAPGANLNQPLSTAGSFIVGYNQLSGNSIPASITIPRDGVISRLHMDVSTNARNVTVRLHVLKNGAFTDLNLDVTAGSTGNFENDEDSFTVEDGDRVAFAFQDQAGGGNTGVFTTSIPTIEFEYD